jgi:phenylalanyl-tRNA synthetase alpha subunit
MKLKSFYTTKEMVTRLKRQSTEWEKILPSYTSEKVLITRIYRELQKLISPKINDLMKKWANELNRAFSKEVQIVKKHIKKCSTHKGNTKQNHIKIPTSFLLEWLSSRTKITTNAGDDLGKKEPSYTVIRNVN